jgi:hypothetical protein
MFAILGLHRLLAYLLIQREMLWQLADRLDIEVNKGNLHQEREHYSR